MTIESVMTKAIILEQLTRLNSAKILDCGDFADKEAHVGMLKCSKCSKEVKRLIDFTLMDTVISCLEKIQIGPISDIYPVIEAQMVLWSKTSEVYQVFASIMSQKSSIKKETEQETASPKKPASAEVPPERNSPEEQRVIIVSLTQHRPSDGNIEDLCSPEVELNPYFKTTYNGTRTEFRARRDDAPFVSLSLQDKSIERSACIEIKYILGSPFSQALIAKGVSLRNDANVHLCEMREVSKCWDMLLDTKILTRSQIQQIYLFNILASDDSDDEDILENDQKWIDSILKAPSDLDKEQLESVTQNSLVIDESSKNTNRALLFEEQPELATKNSLQLVTSRKITNNEIEMTELEYLRPRI